MALLALDINDAAITLLRGDGVLYREPGYALLDQDELLAGEAAFHRARIQPRQIHKHFWANLDIEQLTDQRFRHLTAADLASQQLEDVWRAAGGSGDALIVAVPGYMEKEQLGLFLGICAELGIPVAALVDAAVAATRREYRNASPLHVDVGLHCAVLSRLAQPGRAQLEKTEVVDGCGLVALQNAWLRVIAEAFVKQSRFDPLHTADTEQLLLDRLGGWLDEAASRGTATLEISSGPMAHTAEIDTLALVSAAAPVYQRIVSQLRALCRADEVPALQLSDRAASLPGLAEMLKARVGGEVFLLESGATVRGLLARCQDMQAGQGQVSLVRQLPWDQSPVTIETRSENDDGGRPTHLLFDNLAYALNGTELTLGSQAAERGRRSIDLGGAMPGVSRRHCVLAVENGQCIVRDHSRFGTFLNGHRLDGSAILQTGDLLRVGTPGFEMRLIALAEEDGA